LILDEATAALDAESEEVVQSALDNAAVHRTTICITHKASTARKADNIIFLARGGIAEQGSPESLLETNGYFAQFLAMAPSPPGNPTEKISTDRYQKSFGESDTIKLAEKNSPAAKRASSQVTQPKDLSLIRGVAMILYSQRKSWPWMLALFVPSMLGGTYLDMLWLMHSLRTSYRVHICCSSCPLRKNGQRIPPTCL
jgi:ABC-type multidrug transport system ATPase subunit